MASKTAQQTAADEYEQLFADWVYQVPGLILMLGGFGALAFVTLL